MKFKINITVLVFLAVAFACNKKLDVPPQNQLTPAEIKSADDVKAVLAGAYSTWQNAGAFGEKYNTLTELLVNDNDINFVGTFADYKDINNKEQVAISPTIYQVWANSYQTINVANIVLSKLNILGADDKPVIEGEAKFFRGVTYFYLVNMFAKPYSAGNASANAGVPLILAPVEGYDPQRDKLPRASVEAVYTQVLADLTDAVSKLPKEASNARATKYSAEAMLSRVYLSQAKYTEAATAANDVIQSGEFALTAFDKEFNNASNSSEDIFAIQQTSQSNSGTSNFGITTFYTTFPLGRGEFQITNEHLAKYESGDERASFFYDGTSIEHTDGKMTSKYRDLYKTIPVVRLGEMYLTRAEANFRKGGAPVGPKTPLQDLNTIRNRAGLLPLTSLTSANVIVTERYHELAFEGERFLTVKRLKLTINGRAYDDPKMIFPIPQREIDLSNSLPQNPGY